MICKTFYRILRTTIPPVLHETKKFSSKNIPIAGRFKAKIGSGRRDRPRLDAVDFEWGHSGTGRGQNCVHPASDQGVWLGPVKIIITSQNSLNQLFRRPIVALHSG